MAEGGFSQSSHSIPYKWNVLLRNNVINPFSAGTDLKNQNLTSIDHHIYKQMECFIMQ